jgi:hypothetical protein
LLGNAAIAAVQPPKKNPPDLRPAGQLAIDPSSEVDGLRAVYSLADDRSMPTPCLLAAAERAAR